MRLPIVDNEDTVIGFKERNDLLEEDTYRVSALWITNSSGKHLLAQRALTKKHGPGKWGPAVAGTVEEGEDYEINILKEIQEELGITLTRAELRTGPKTHRIPTGSSAYFTQWYFAKVDKDLNDFRYPEEEVMALKWVTSDELRAGLREYPETFLPAIHESAELLLSEAKKFST